MDMRVQIKTPLAEAQAVSYSVDIATGYREVMRFEVIAFLKSVDAHTRYEVRTLQFGRWYDGTLILRIRTPKAYALMYGVRKDQWCGSESTFEIYHTPDEMVRDPKWLPDASTAFGSQEFTLDEYV